MLYTLNIYNFHLSLKYFKILKLALYYKISFITNVCCMTFNNMGALLKISNHLKILLGRFKFYFQIRKLRLRKAEPFDCQSDADG